MDVFAGSGEKEVGNDEEDNRKGVENDSDDVVFGELDFFLGFVTKDETVVEEVVQGHSDGSGKNEDAGTFDEIIIKREVDGAGNIKAKLVKWGDKPEEHSEEWADDEGGEEIPKEEIDDTGFGRAALLPSNTGMSKVSDEG